MMETMPPDFASLLNETSMYKRACAAIPQVGMDACERLGSCSEALVALCKHIVKGVGIIVELYKILSTDM